jgi:hypothetical protein
MLAMALVGIVAAALAVVPALVALRLLAFPAGGIGAALACVGAAVTGVKLVAMAWAVGARLWAPHPAAATVAFPD